jgi:hypothetical protein
VGCGSKKVLSFEAVVEAEVALRFGYIFLDLGFEGLGRGPLDFASEAEEKFEFDRGGIVEFDGFEV